MRTVAKQDPAVAMEVTTTKLEEASLLSVQGGIDHSVCRSVEVALREAAAPGKGIVLLDLRRVPYMDRGGLSLLFSGVPLVRDRGGVGVIGPTSDVRRLLEIVGLLVDPRFRVYEDTEAARDALRGPVAT